MATGSAIIIIPENIVIKATNLPIVVIGYWSPYPIVVIVINAHYIVAGILVYGDSVVESIPVVYICYSSLNYPGSALYINDEDIIISIVTKNINKFNDGKDFINPENINFIPDECLLTLKILNALVNLTARSTLKDDICLLEKNNPIQYGAIARISIILNGMIKNFAYDLSLNTFQANNLHANSIVNEIEQIASIIFQKAIGIYSFNSGTVSNINANVLIPINPKIKNVIDIF